MAPRIMVVDDEPAVLKLVKDGYIAKPIKPEELYDAIESFGAGSGASAAGGSVLQTCEGVVDMGALLARVDGDRELLTQMTALFLEEYPKLLAAIRQAVSRRDAKELERAAHTLKGTVGNFAAQSAVDAALVLEGMGRDGDLNDAQKGYQVLEQEIERLRPVLASLKQESAR